MNQQRLIPHQIASQGIQDQTTYPSQANKLLFSRIIKYPTENLIICHNSASRDSIKIQPSDDNIQASLTDKIMSNFKRYGEDMSVQSPRCSSEVQVKMEQVQGRSRSFAVKAQNLKKISWHIKNLIQSNAFISIKHLSFLLYQIIAQTDLGRQLYQKSYLNLQKSIYSYLQDKYDKNVHQYDLNFVVKNVRRRIYDSINVMIATGIVSKNHKHQLAITDHFQKISKNPIFSINHFQGRQKSSKSMTQKKSVNFHKKYLTLRSLLAQKEAILEEKRRNVLKLRKQYVLLQKNGIRNHYKQLEGPSIHSLNQENYIFKLPIIMINSNPQMIMSIQTTQFHLYSPSQLSVFSDVDILQLILQQRAGKTSKTEQYQTHY